MKKTGLWILAIFITLAAAVYQRMTGPTYPKRTVVAIGEARYDLKLVRSHAGEQNCPVELNISDPGVKGTLEYRLYPTKSEFTRVEMTNDGKTLRGELPHQPKAGKIEYKITLEKDSNLYPVNQGHSTVVRFRGDVPAFVIIPHIIAMFLAMLFSNAAGLFALFNIPTRKSVNTTLFLLFIGGLILGPIVQEYAFDELWAGVPFGWDLTDNKTLIAFVAWVIAAMWAPKGENRKAILIASVITILIFSIPHSMFGSELDPESGKIIQGIIMPFIR